MSRTSLAIMQHFDDELRRLGDWSIVLNTIQSWHAGLPYRRSIRHPLVPRMHAIQALLQTIQTISIDDYTQAHQYVKVAGRAGKKWLQEAQSGSSSWYLPEDNDVSDLFVGFWIAFALVAEKLASWEARFTSARVVAIEQGEYTNLEAMELCLSRGRAMRAGIEALIVCTYDDSLIAHAWITVSQHRIAMLSHEIEAWHAFTEILENRGNR